MMAGSMIQRVLVMAMAVGHIYGSPVWLSNHQMLNELVQSGAAEGGRVPTIAQVITAANNGRDDLVIGEDTIGEGVDTIDLNGLDAAVEDGRTPTIAQVIFAVNDGAPDVIPMEDEDIGNGGDRKRALRHKSYFWPNGTIPYNLHAYFTIFDWMYPDAEAKIRSAMDIWEEVTCLKFVHSPNAAEGDSHVLIFPGSGCSSNVGWHNVTQGISLAAGCLREDIIVHELGHTIGYFHEQSRYDRDNHVTIDLTNVPDRWKHNFNPQARANSEDVGVPYDYRSIMHYPAIIRQEWGTVITTNDPHFQDKIGRYKYLSFGDIKGINLAYQCGAHCANSCHGDAFLDKDCQCMCHDSTQDRNRRATVPCADLPQFTTTTQPPPPPTTQPLTTQPTTTQPPTTQPPTTQPATTQPPTTQPPTTPPPTTQPPTTQPPTTPPPTTPPPTTQPLTTQPPTTQPLTTQPPTTPPITTPPTTQPPMTTPLTTQPLTTQPPTTQPPTTQPPTTQPPTTQPPTTTPILPATTTPTDCFDKIDDCARWDHYCEEPFFQTHFHAQCPLTCKLCVPCTDKAPNCAALAGAGYCDHGTFQDEMTEICRRTCNRCDGSA